MSFEEPQPETRVQRASREGRYEPGRPLGQVLGAALAVGLVIVAVPLTFTWLGNRSPASYTDSGLRAPSPSDPDLATSPDPTGDRTPTSSASSSAPSRTATAPGRSTTSGATRDPSPGQTSPDDAAGESGGPSATGRSTRTPARSATTPPKPGTTAPTATRATGRPPSTRGTYGERTTSRVSQAVVLVQNGTTPAARERLADTAMWHTQFFTTVADWFTTISGGRYTYTPAGPGVYTVAADQATLAKSGAGQCAGTEARQQAEATLAARGVSSSSVVVVFDSVGCDWGGLATVGGDNSGGGVYWSPSALNIHADVHELGHNLGFNHAPYVTCARGAMSACGSVGSGYGATQMGGAGAEVGFSAPERLFAGFIDSAGYFATNGNGTVELIAAYAPESESGVRALEVVTGGSSNYVFELRTPTSRSDSTLSGVAGVRGYRVPVSGGRADYRNGALIRLSGADDRGLLPAGTTITDGSMQVTIGSRGTVSIAGL